MIEIVYKHSGCIDFRFFRSEDEADEWITRQMIINLDTEILEKRLS